MWIYLVVIPWDPSSVAAPQILGSPDFVLGESAVRSDQVKKNEAYVVTSRCLLRLAKYGLSE